MKKVICREFIHCGNSACRHYAPHTPRKQVRTFKAKVMTFEKEGDKSVWCHHEELTCRPFLAEEARFQSICLVIDEK